MLRDLTLTLYGVALALASPVAVMAEPIDPALLSGTMAKLQPLEAAAPAVTEYTLFDGGTGDLSDYAGQVVVLNFWATWCAPCRAEMPSLQALQDEMGDGDLEVVTVAFGRHNPVQMKRFWAETGVNDLPLHIDPDSALARGLGVRGLPHTFVLDRDGQVVAQLIGEADWAAPETLAVMEAYLAQ